MADHSLTCEVPNGEPVVQTTPKGVGKKDAKKEILESGLPKSLSNPERAEITSHIDSERIRTGEILAMRQLKEMWKIETEVRGYETKEVREARQAAFEKKLSDYIKTGSSSSVNFYRETLKGMLGVMGKTSAARCDLLPQGDK